MQYESPNYKNGSPNGIPSNEDIVKTAWECVPKLGLDPTHMAQKSFFTHLYQVDESGNDKPNFICGRGVFLSRLVDGISFFSADNTGYDIEGFALELGSYGEIRSFSFRWSSLERYQRQQTASVQEIIRCMKAHKTIVLPNIAEEHYFARLRTLATAKKLTITKITPVYGDGVLGEVPTNDAPCNFAVPFAELEAVADFGTSNTTLRLVSPILSPEIERLLRGK